MTLILERWFLGLAVVFGAVFFVFGYGPATNGVYTTGRVDSPLSFVETDSGGYYKAWVTYRDQSGFSHRQNIRIAPGVDQGDTFRVLYDSQNPTNVDWRDKTDFIMSAFVLPGIWVALTGAGVLWSRRGQVILRLRGETTTGQVTEAMQWRRIQNWRSNIVFDDEAGTRHVLTTAGKYDGMVDVVYDPRRPSRAIVADRLRRRATSRDRRRVREGLPLEAHTGMPLAIIAVPTGLLVVAAVLIVTGSVLLGGP